MCSDFLLEILSDSYGAFLFNSVFIFQQVTRNAYTTNNFICYIQLQSNITMVTIENNKRNSNADSRPSKGVEKRKEMSTGKKPERF